MVLEAHKRIASLDGLRAMSILLVIIGHLLKGRGTTALISAFGVHVFFVLSGYLITRLLQEERTLTGHINLLAFYMRRAFRIFPAAFAYICIITLIVPASRSGLIYAVTYTTSYHPVGLPLVFQHLWSLSVEEQFYLLWPCAMMLWFRQRQWIAWSAMILAAGFRLVVALSASAYSVAYLHYSFPGTMDSIAAGCLLAIYEPAIRRHAIWATESWAIAIAVPLTAWILQVVTWGKLGVFWGIVPLLLAFWVFMLIEREDWIFNNSLATAIGILSYSLYLWQQPTLLGNSEALIWQLMMLTGFAVASFFFIERPVLRLGSSLQRSKLASLPLTKSARIAATD